MAAPSLVIHASTAELGLPHIAYACPLSPTTLLCFGMLKHEFAQHDSIACGRVPAQKPYLGTVLRERGEHYLLMLLNFKNSVSAPGDIVITRNKQRLAWPFEAGAYDKSTRRFGAWAGTLSQQSLRRVLWLLLRFMIVTPGAANPLLAAACFELRRRVTDILDTTQAHWLPPATFGCEYLLPEPPAGPLQLVAITRSQIHMADFTSRPLGNNTYEGQAAFATAPEHPLLTLVSETKMYCLPAAALKRS